MGDWSITINGTGSHHNGLRDDADEIASEFVERLKKAGQSVRNAEFVSGAKQELPKPALDEAGPQEPVDKLRERLSGLTDEFRHGHLSPEDLVRLIDRIVEEG